MIPHHAHHVLAEALSIAAEELDGLIDRHFALNRTLIVEREGVNWTATIDDTVLYRHPDGEKILSWARTFAERTAGVTVAVEPGLHGFSVKVAPLAEVVPPRKVEA